MFASRHPWACYGSLTACLEACTWRQQPELAMEVVHATWPWVTEQHGGFLLWRIPKTMDSCCNSNIAQFWMLLGHRHIKKLPCCNFEATPASEAERCHKTAIVCSKDVHNDNDDVWPKNALCLVQVDSVTWESLEPRSPGIFRPTAWPWEMWREVLFDFSYSKWVKTPWPSYAWDLYPT